MSNGKDSQEVGIHLVTVKIMIDEMISLLNSLKTELDSIEKIIVNHIEEKDNESS